MRILLLPAVSLLLTLAHAPLAEAQVLYVAFKSEKFAKKFKDNLTELRGRQVVIGEVKAGIKLQNNVVNYTGGAEAKNELWVGDPGKPNSVPYKWEGERRKKAGKNSSISFAGDQVAHMGFVDQFQTLEGVAEEYELRQTRIKEAKAARDEFKKGDRQWFANHGKMVAQYDSLRSWMKAMGYPVAARKLKKTIDRERKVVAKEASAAREQKALSSLREAKTPEKLIEATQKVTGGTVQFRMVESQHVRFIYNTDISDSEAMSCLELCEQIVEGFRKEFVDPYLDDDFRDYIPDGQFVEFFFGPEKREYYERFMIDYYGRGWSKTHKERQLDSGGTSFSLGRSGYCSYYKTQKERDLQGTVAHSMGNHLADAHFNKIGRNDPQPWLESAVGYYVSFNFLGRNTLTRFSWNVGEYAAPAKEEGEKTVQRGMKGAFNEIAITRGPTIEALSLKSLGTMNDVDFAKAWSIFDFIARKEGKRGQQWLRAACSAARGKNFIQRWREASQELFETEEGVDVFGVIEQEWKAYAQRDQLR